MNYLFNLTRKSIFCYCVLLIVLIIIACAPTVKTRYFKTIDYYVDPPTLNEQTKEGVTIKLEPFNQKQLINDPLYKKRVKKAGLLTTKVEELSEVEAFVNPFVNRTTFKVTITNNTDHILRMTDARIFYVSNQSMDTPVSAGTRAMLMADVESHPEVIRHRSKGYDYEEAIAVSWEIAQQTILASNKLKIINDVGMEILPKFSASGMLVFPLSPENVAEGKVTFFDITTKVDNAGNPIQKEQYAFALKVNEKFYKTVGKETFEVTREEVEMNIK